MREQQENLPAKKRERMEKKENKLTNERMLRLFETLKVPPGKLGELKNVLSLQLAEKQILETNEKTLIQLQVFQEGGTGALHLPELPKYSLQAPTLQEGL
nr:centromere protein Q-like [Anas platyrhynchos]